MEPATKVAPDDNELVYDRVIDFGPAVISRLLTRAARM